VRWNVPQGAAGLGLCGDAVKADIGQSAVIELRQQPPLTVHGKHLAQGQQGAHTGSQGGAGERQDRHGGILSGL